MNKRKIEILYHLYTFRFLSRNHIQLLIGHKHHNRIIVWLNEMTESGLVRKYYDPKKVTVPAIYSLGLKGRKYLKDTEDDSINIDVLDRVWREPKLSAEFIEHCLFIADCYLSLKKLCNENNTVLHFYTKTQLKGMEGLISPHPDAYIAIEESSSEIKRYFLDIFDTMPPRMLLRKRTKQYLDYYEEEIWQSQTDKPFPKIIMITPDERSFNYLYRFIQTSLDYFDEPEIYLSMKETIKQKGFNSGALTHVEVIEE